MEYSLSHSELHSDLLSTNTSEEHAFFFEATKQLYSSLAPDVSMTAFIDYISRFLPLHSFSLTSMPPPFTQIVSVTRFAEGEPVRCPFEVVHVGLEQARLAEQLGFTRAESFKDYLLVSKEDPMFRYMTMFGLGEPTLPMFFMRLIREQTVIGSVSICMKTSFTDEHFRLMRGLEGPLGMALSNMLQHHELEQLKEEILQDNQRLRQELKGLTHVDVIGSGRGLAWVMQRVKQAAPVDVPILITGETGTGKEVIAKAIHELSPRAPKFFVAVNCGAIPATLIDSVLFGHAKGAFTGATANHKGYFERAEGGTLFLDEIGELPLQSQARLLRVLETHEIEKVGGAAPLRVDIRLLAATNRNLRDMISAGTFREDLYYRLNVVSVQLPPLRERKEDIPLLVQYLLRKSAARFGVLTPPLAQGEMERLLAYSWPGNVRELQNVLEEALVCTAPGSPLRLHLESQTRISPSSDSEVGCYEDMQRGYFEKLLMQTGGRISGPKGAALMAGINPSTFRFKCKKLGIALGPNMR